MGIACRPRATGRMRSAARRGLRCRHSTSLRSWNSSRTLLLLNGAEADHEIPVTHRIHDRQPAAADDRGGFTDTLDPKVYRCVATPVVHVERPSFIRIASLAKDENGQELILQRHTTSLKLQRRGITRDGRRPHLGEDGCDSHAENDPGFRIHASKLQRYPDGSIGRYGQARPRQSST